MKDHLGAWPTDYDALGRAEAEDRADLTARRSAAGIRLCEKRNRRRLPPGWWMFPMAILGGLLWGAAGYLVLALWL